MKYGNIKHNVCVMLFLLLEVKLNQKKEIILSVMFVLCRAGLLIRQVRQMTSARNSYLPQFGFMFEPGRHIPGFILNELYITFKFKQNDFSKMSNICLQRICFLFVIFFFLVEYLQKSYAIPLIRN